MGRTQFRYGSDLRLALGRRKSLKSVGFLPGNGRFVAKSCSIVAQG